MTTTKTKKSPDALVPRGYRDAWEGLIDDLDTRQSTPRVYLSALDAMIIELETRRADAAARAAAAADETEEPEADDEPGSLFDSRGVDDEDEFDPASAE